MHKVIAINHWQGLTRNPNGFDALFDKMADNDHIKPDNIEIKVNVSL